ncbi:outer membrane protein assembly factor BamE [Pseudothauera nasutitermitis]|uniref:Outer membrane protein assembly factor BamE n=1 Tax=Pseudothauera nasutitermitis TaxID=2565930 RepID=A0A4S4B2W4_9RHOO|nr:DUF3862 domain-containing protein [Pseudothauera nasutitermitis]THF66525.1 outer membrane protein assembly factor BamE [Pseudothauera nasutitermitis]
MKTITLLVPVLAVAALAGCTKLTAENYNRLKPGMSYEEVRAILGKPDSCSDLLAARNCTWGNEQRSINVSFVGDQAVLFQSDNIR